MATGELIEYWLWPDDDGLDCGRVIAIHEDAVEIASVDASGFSDETDLVKFEDIFAIKRHTEYLARLEVIAKSPPLPNPFPVLELEGADLFRRCLANDQIALFSRPEKQAEGDERDAAENDDSSAESFVHRVRVEAFEDDVLQCIDLSDSSNNCGVLTIRLNAIVNAKTDISDSTEVALAWRIRERQTAEKLHSDAPEILTNCAREVLRAYAAVHGPNSFVEAGNSFGSFTGIESPITQALGYLAADEIATIAEFYRSHSTPWEVSVHPDSHPEALSNLLKLGAVPMGFESEYALPLPRLSAVRPCSNSRIQVYEIDDSELDKWGKVLHEGFGEEEDPDSIDGLVSLLCGVTGFTRFMATWDGVPAAACHGFRRDNYAYLGGMTTKPVFRGRGIQAAMIEHRIRWAQDTGATMALVTASPGTSSERNILRAGFRLIYNRIGLKVPAT